MTQQNVPDIVQRGITAARVGDVDEARRMLDAATAEYPDSIEAWMGLAGVVNSLTEKRRCFNKVLALDPTHIEAQEALKIIEEKLAAELPPEGEALYCYRHSDRETALRCNRCNRPICPKCATRTPVGFRCPDCIREQEDKYFSGEKYDYLIAVGISLPLFLITIWLFGAIIGGFGFFALFIALFAVPFITGLVSEAVRWGVSRRRSRYLPHTVIACMVIATLPTLLPFFLSFNPWTLITPGAFLLLGTNTIFYRLR